MNKVINNIHKLPLHSFIDALCDDDYSGLVASGEPSQDEIAGAWDEILFQYQDALKDDSQKQFVSAHADYYRAKTKHDLAITYIEMLNYYYSQGIVVKKWIIELNRLCHIRFEFNVDKNEEFESYLVSCNNRNKSNLVQYQLAQMRLEEIMKIQGAKEQEKPDRGYFTQIMVNLKNQNTREIPDTISTYEFCVLVNRYQEYIKRLEKEKRKR
jgi:hypothetical protein